MGTKRKTTHVRREQSETGVISQAAQFEDSLDYPHPEHLIKLHEANPDYAVQVLKSYKDEQDHRHKREDRILIFNFIIYILSLLGAITIIGMICFTALKIAQLKDGDLNTFAAVIGGLALLVGVFLIRKWWQKRPSSETKKKPG